MLQTKKVYWGYEMKSFEYTLTIENGIHARPAGKLIQLISKFNSEITIKNTRNNKSSKISGIFSILVLELKKDDVITINIDGTDENEACEAIKNFFENL